MAHVLVVDDCRTVLAAVRGALEADGHEVRGVSLVASVPSLIQEQRPDVILLDLQLSGISGVDLGRTFGALGIPVVVYSSAPRADVQRAAREVGAVASLEKGRPMTELRHLVAQVLRGPRRSASPSRPDSSRGR